MTYLAWVNSCALRLARLDCPDYFNVACDLAAKEQDRETEQRRTPEQAADEWMGAKQ